MESSERIAKKSEELINNSNDRCTVNFDDVDDMFCVTISSSFIYSPCVVTVETKLLKSDNGVYDARSYADIDSSTSFLLETSFKSRGSETLYICDQT